MEKDTSTIRMYNFDTKGANAETVEEIQNTLAVAYVRAGMTGMVSHEPSRDHEEVMHFFCSYAVGEQDTLRDIVEEVLGIDESDVPALEAGIKKQGIKPYF